MLSWFSSVYNIAVKFVTFNSIKSQEVTLSKYFSDPLDNRSIIKSKGDFTMEIGVILFNGFIVAGLLFILSSNIFAKIMTSDKWTLISSALTGLVCAVLAILCPITIRETAMIVFAIVVAVIVLFKK